MSIDVHILMILIILINFGNNVNKLYDTPIELGWVR